MKSRSIRTRLVVGIGVIVSLILISGAFVIYHTVKASLYEEVDKALAGTLALQSLELEIIGDEIVNEWLTDIEQDPQRRLSDYIQVWDEKSGQVLRSPALEGHDLPKLSGPLNVRRFASCELPDGKRARAVGVRMYPKVEEDTMSAVIRAEDYPHVMVIAQETEDIDARISGLFQVLLQGLLLVGLFCLLVIHLIIRASLRPIHELELEISRVDASRTMNDLVVPAGIPVELQGLTQKYRELLGRINRVRGREREFSANAAHELRTPIAGIMAVLEQTLSSDRKDSEYRERIAEALEISVSMQTLVNRLTRFARLRNGIDHIELTTMDLHTMIDARLSLLDRRLKERGLQLHRQLDASQPLIRTDETLVEILVGNLIGNAVSHADVNSQVSLATEDTETGCRFTLSNFAAKLKQEDMERIFEPFYRVDRARTLGDGHSGLGLAMCREIASTLDLEFQAELDSVGHLFRITVIFPEK
ncbi:sensor histidine kinase [Coraliomargarita parva]|uniref:sensor histidine kinase n=1 Tax=Coraliomargarita parva TaxID=3014050 RepID=UPI0022B34880|nr:histidine kinase dimerization/phospho-acceptor domain-containing protein [Coraliomargarita parva]